MAQFCNLSLFVPKIFITLDIRGYGINGCEILTLRKQNNLSQNIKDSNVRILYPVLQSYYDTGFVGPIRLDSITLFKFSCLLFSTFHITYP